jgi:hypothetical protein
MMAMYVNIQVKIHESDVKDVRDGRMDKRLAIEQSVDHGHYAVIETIDEGEDNDNQG